jgi:hypothetical protein
MEPAAILCITRTAICNRDFLSKKAPARATGSPPTAPLLAIAPRATAGELRPVARSAAEMSTKVAPTITVACSKHDPSRRERYHPDGNCPSVNQSL